MSDEQKQMTPEIRAAIAVLLGAGYGVEVPVEILDAKSDYKPTVVVYAIGVVGD